MRRTQVKKQIAINEQWNETVDMIKSKGIFAVSFIAMMVVGGAYANIASQGYVDQQVDAKQNASTAVKVATAGTAVGDATHPVYVNANGVATRIDKVAAAVSADTATSATKATQDASGNVITTTYATKTELNAKADAEDIPTVNNATLTIQKNGTAVATFTANSATGATANITVPTKVSELNNDSGFITAASLPDEYELKPATADALGGVKSGGDITVGTDGTVTVNGKLSSISGSTGGTGNVVTSVSASGSTVTATKSITAEETKNKVKSVRAAVSATDTAYPSEKAVATALEDKADKSELSDYATNTRVDAVEDKAEAAQTAADDAADAAAAAQTAANSKVTANAAITAGTATKITYDAKGLVTAGASLTANDIPTIPSTKVSGLGTLATKSAVASAEIADGTIVNADIAPNAAIAASKISGLATVATSGSYDDLTDKPTIPAAITVDSVLSSTSTNPVQNKVVNAAINAAQSTADDAADAASAAQSTATAAQNAINNLDVSTASGSGNVVTSVTQSNGKISVTKGNVQIPVGSATATSYATIWVQ